MNAKQLELDEERASHSTTKTSNAETLSVYKETQHQVNKETAEEAVARLLSAKNEYLENLSDQKKSSSLELENEKREHSAELAALQEGGEKTLSEKINSISQAHERTITSLKSSHGRELQDVKSDAARELVQTEGAAARAAATAATTLQKEMRVQKTTLILLAANMNVTIGTQKKLDATRQALNVATKSSKDAATLALRERAALLSRLHLMGANVKHLNEELHSLSEDNSKLLNGFMFLGFVLWFLISQVSNKEGEKYEVDDDDSEEEDESEEDEDESEEDEE